MRAGAVAGADCFGKGSKCLRAVKPLQVTGLWGVWGSDVSTASSSHQPEGSGGLALCRLRWGNQSCKLPVLSPGKTQP